MAEVEKKIEERMTKMDETAPDVRNGFGNRLTWEAMLKGMLHWRLVGWQDVNHSTTITCLALGEFYFFGDRAPIGPKRESGPSRIADKPF